MSSPAFRIAVGIAACSAFFLLVQHEHPKPDHPVWSGAYIAKKTIKDMPASIGNGEDLSGRDYFDWMRLRDPRIGEVPTQIRKSEMEFARTIPSRLTALRKGEGGGGQAIDWAQRGPHNVGGRTRALAIDPRNTAVMLAGGVSGGMWRSTNSGISWEKVAPAEDIHSTTSIAQDLRPGKEDTWYYGTGELRGNSASGGGGSLYRGDGIFKSTDNGLSWTKLPSTSTANVQFDQPFDYVWNLALSRTDFVRDIVVAATLGTIQLSTNGGQSWTAVLGTTTNDAGPRYTDVVSTQEGVFYATLSSKNMVSANTNATGKGIWRSTDGITWTNISPPAWPTDYNRVVIAVAPSDPNVVYFLAETPGTGPTGHMLWKYIYVSGDGTGSGGMWVDRSGFLPNLSGLDGNAVFGSQVSYDLVAAVYPTDADVVFIGGINLYRSNDGGQTSGTWTRIGGYAGPSTYARYENNHPDHHALVFHPSNPSVLFNGNDGGVFRTNNPLAGVVSWTPLNNGYYTTQFYTIALDPGTDGDLSIIGGMQDNGTWYTTSENAVTPWIEVAGGDGAFCQLVPGGATLYVSFQNGVTYRLSENGSGRVDPLGASGYLFINPFILDPVEPRRMYMAGGSTIWRNTNLDEIPLGSSSPTSVNWTNMVQTEAPGASITAMAASTDRPGILYYGSSAGRVYKLRDAFKDKPSPIDLWENAGFPVGGYVSAIAVDPLNADHLLVCFSNYGVRSIFASTNGGSSWTDVSGNLEESPDGSGNGPSVRWVAILPDSAAYFYFAATSTGLYVSRALTGPNTVWLHEATEAIGYPVINMLDVRTSDGHVVVGTHGRGAFSATIPVVEPPPPSQSPAGVPVSLAVSLNFPNPFNAGTSVTVTPSATGHVVVEVYDIAGRLVDRLADGVFPGGVSAPVVWDGRDMTGASSASGIYFIVARSESSLNATKAALIR